MTQKYQKMSSSLIPFPADKIFDTELHTFDVVIFQNFDFRPYYMARYLKNIREAVEGGLGFVMLGGEQSFADGGYPGTELAPIIAFDLDARGLAQTSSGIALTPQGESHPSLIGGTERFHRRTGRPSLSGHRLIALEIHLQTLRCSPLYKAQMEVPTRLLRQRK